MSQFQDVTPPWVVGIDEAGYGPNLGPFVMAGVMANGREREIGLKLLKA